MTIVNKTSHSPSDENIEQKIFTSLIKSIQQNFRFKNLSQMDDKAKDALKSESERIANAIEKSAEILFSCIKEEALKGATKYEKSVNFFDEPNDSLKVTIYKCENIISNYFRERYNLKIELVANFSKDIYDVTCLWENTNKILYHKIVISKPVIKKDESQQFGRFRENPEFSDATIKVDTTIFKVHAVILCCKNQIFNKLFDSQMKEATEKEIVVKETSAEAMKLFLDYLYGIDINKDLEILNGQNKFTLLFELLDLSEKYQDSPLKQLCAWYLNESLKEDHTVESLKNLVDLSDRYNFKDLKNNCQLRLLSLHP